MGSIEEICIGECHKVGGGCVKRRRSYSGGRWVQHRVSPGSV